MRKIKATDIIVKNWVDLNGLITNKVHFETDLGFVLDDINFAIRKIGYTYRSIQHCNGEMNCLSEAIPKLEKVVDVMREYLLCDINNYKYQSGTKLVKINKEDKCKK